MWTAVPPAPGTSVDAAAASGAVFALRAPGAISLRDTGGGWRDVLDLGPRILATGTVAGTRVAVAADGLARLEGTRWTTMARADAPFATADRVFGLATDDLWVVDLSGSAYHWDGARWSALPHPGDGVFRTGAAAAGRAWFVGDEPTVVAGVSTQRFRLWRLDRGGTLAPVTALGDDDVSDVVALGSGETLVFATRRVGSGFGPWSRLLWRNDGASWSELWTGAPTDEQGWWPIRGITDAGDVWATANAAVAGGETLEDLLHWDGARMQRVAQLRGAQGSLAAVVARGEAWLSTGDETRQPELGGTTFLRATTAGLDAAPIASLPAIARELWASPGGRVDALTDASAVWEAQASCAGP